MDNYSEYLYALEEYMDELEAELNSDYMLAMEAESASDGTEAPSSIGTKIRSLFNKLKRAVKRGDSAEAEQINSQIKKEASKMDDIEDSIEDGDTRKKKGWATAAKIGLAAAAAALIGVTAVAAGNKYGKEAQKNNKQLKGIGKKWVDASNTLTKMAKSAPGRAANAIKSTRVGDFMTRAYDYETGKGTGKVMAAVNSVGHYAKYKGDRAVKGAKKMGAKVSSFFKGNESYVAREAAEAVASTYGIPAYDVYDVIMEAYESSNMSIEDFDAQLAAEFED